MASEQFSLCWDNFHKNMSSGMNALLENEDLVDVTLAVEGKYLKAHKMVLSVCSPYFKELFKTNPCKHPIVFMKDVSYIALSDLLQFMYQGEVQVSQENLTTFIKTAEALQIKGLTGDGNGTTENELDHDEKSVQQLVDEYKSIPQVPRPKKVHSAPASTPAPKRPRLSASSSEVVSTPAVTKTEPINSSAPSTEIVQFKMEPYDQSQTISLHDESVDETFGDDTLDETAAEDTEDYSMIEGNEEEPQAGTSTEGTGEGQVLEGPNTPNTVQAKIDDLMREVMSVENEIVDTDVEETNIQPEKPVKRVGKSNLSHTICSVVTMEILDMLPLTTVDDVDNLACDVMDEDIKLQYVSYLENYISRNPEITIKKMLGSVFSEELISEYAWFGGKKKRAVKDLSFIQIMEDVIRGAFPYLRKHFFKRETGAYLRRYMLTRKSTRSESTRNDE